MWNKRIFFFSKKVVKRNYLNRTFGHWLLITYIETFSVITISAMIFNFCFCCGQLHNRKIIIYRMADYFCLFLEFFIINWWILNFLNSQTANRIFNCKSITKIIYFQAVLIDYILRFDGIHLYLTTCFIARIRWLIFI